MKLLLIITMLSVLSCLPQEEGRSAAAEQERLKPKPCAIQFEKDFALQTIAETARKMKTQCNLSEEEVIKLAKRSYN